MQPVHESVLPIQVHENIQEAVSKAAYVLDTSEDISGRILTQDAKRSAGESLAFDKPDGTKRAFALHPLPVVPARDPTELDHITMNMLTAVGLTPRQAVGVLAAVAHDEYTFADTTHDPSHPMYGHQHLLPALHATFPDAVKGLSAKFKKI